MGNSSRCCHEPEPQEFVEAKAFPTLEKEGISQRSDPQPAFAKSLQKTVELRNAEEPVVVSYLELLRNLPDSADSILGSPRPASDAETASPPRCASDTETASSASAGPTSSASHVGAQVAVNKKESSKAKAKPKAKRKKKPQAENKPKDRASASGKAFAGSPRGAEQALDHNKPKDRASASGKPFAGSPRGAEQALDRDLLSGSVRQASPPLNVSDAKLSVFIMSASGLQNADWMGKSDPFCTAELVGYPRTRVKTSVVRQTLAPHWNEGFELAYNGGTDLLFKVWDKDPLLSDDPLGEATLKHEEFQNGFNGDILLSGQGHVGGSLHVKAVLMTSRYISAEGVDLPRLIPPGLTIRIRSAKGLVNADWFGKSDPYCVCRFSDMPETTIVTEVIQNTLEPEWNATFRTVYFPRKDLYFEVWDKDIFKDDLLGKATLKEFEFHPRWHPEGFQGTLPLSGGLGKKKAGTINVEVRYHEGRGKPSLGRS